MTTKTTTELLQEQEVGTFIVVSPDVFIAGGVYRKCSEGNWVLLLVNNYGFRWGSDEFESILNGATWALS